MKMCTTASCVSGGQGFKLKMLPYIGVCPIFSQLICKTTPIELATNFSLTSSLTPQLLFQPTVPTENRERKPRVAIHGSQGRKRGDH